MTTIQELSMKELFEVRDACWILNKYCLADPKIVDEVNKEIAGFRDGGDR